LSDFAERDLGFEPIVVRHDIDPHRAIPLWRVHRPEVQCGAIGVQLREARFEPGEVRVELDRAAV
jgi:hypothetical protein